MIFVHSFAYAGWRKWSHAVAVIRATRIMHFKGVPKFDALMRKIS